MQIKATFANRRHDPELLELVEAWDEYSIDANEEGYEKAVERALTAMGGDLLRYVTVTIDVPDPAIMDALNPAPLRLVAEVRGR